MKNMQCNLYDRIRQDVFVNVMNIESDFLSLDTFEQFCQFMSYESFAKYTAKACNDI